MSLRAEYRAERKPWSGAQLLARRGHQRCHCNEEGFGTLSRQLEMMKVTAISGRV
jgi:hypothetical protein